MITGDARQVADAVAADLGIDEVFAEVLPEDKDQGRRAAARGRGSRWSATASTTRPALARADVGIAIGAGTDVAIESAGVVLASSDPRGVAGGVIRLSQAGYRKMVQNLAWAAGYNVVAIPLAAGVLAWAGITLSPAVGAILMSLSTIVVAAPSSSRRPTRTRSSRRRCSPRSPTWGSNCRRGRRSMRLETPRWQPAAWRWHPSSCPHPSATCACCVTLTAT